MRNLGNAMVRNLGKSFLTGSPKDPFDEKELSILIGTKGLSMKKAGALMQFEKSPGSASYSNNQPGEVRVTKFEKEEKEKEGTSISFKTEESMETDSNKSLGDKNSSNAKISQIAN